MIKQIVVISSLLTLSKFILGTQNNSFINSSNVKLPPTYYSSYQWAIDDIELGKAWEISTGSSSVLVGIIDNGVRGTHEDLSSNINSSLSTISSTTSYTDSLNDLHGHGTHIAGIIGADGSNSVGIAGVCWDVNLVSLRGGYISGGKVYINNEEISEFLEYATDNNISILNISYGSYNYDSDLLSDLSDYNGLVVCSAGNDGYNTDLSGHHHYPSGYDLSNIISVGSSTSSDLVSSTSNYGQDTVDLFAPGTEIKSTMKNSDSDYANWSGTSMAAPYVTGVAALLKSINPNLTPAQIKSAILSNVDSISSMSDKCVSGGRLNAYKAALSVLPTFTINQSVNSVCPIEVGGHQWYKINAQAVTRQFYNMNSINLTAALYSDIQNTTPLVTGSSNGAGYLFNYSFPSEGTYYLKVTNNSSYSGNYSIWIHNNHVHNYGEPYVWKNNTHHYATCSCGNTTSQPHVIQSGTNTCMLCLGTASGGFIGPNGIGQSILTDSYLYPNGIISLGNIDYSSYVNGILTIEDIYGWNSL